VGAGVSDLTAAVASVRALAAPHRLRVVRDAEGYPVIPGKFGQIEYHDGTRLAAYTAGRKDRLGRLLSLPGITRHQVGDTEVRILFPVGMLPEVAHVIRARRRKQVSPGHLAKLRGSLLQRGSRGPESSQTFLAMAR
jgi:hypothetical protein